jgi:hypothetical protein
VSNSTLTAAMRVSVLRASGGADLDSLVTGHHRLNEVEHALTADRRDPTTVKAVDSPGA